jgi:hypothetical protein
MLTASFCLIGCNPNQTQQIQQTDTPSPFWVIVDENRLPDAPGTMKVTTDWLVKQSLKVAAKEKGISLRVYSVTNVENAVTNNPSRLWRVVVGVDGVGDIDTLKCIAKTLVEIPFVYSVGNQSFTTKKST